MYIADMIPVQNQHVSRLDDIIGPTFKELYVRQIVEARDSVFQDMCNDLNVTDHHSIQACNLNKRSVTKDKLVGWLETVCYILDSFSVPLLQNAVPFVERIGELQEDKIQDQATILELQREVIMKREQELKAVQTTVEKEMKSYSSAVAKSCSAALSTKKIESAVRKVADIEDSSKNVIIYGVDESENEKLQEKVSGVLEKIGEKPLVRECCRVGVKKPDSDLALPRPIKFSLHNSDHVAQVLRNAKQLRTEEGYKSVYICPDRTVEERRAYKKLLEQLREKRKSEPERDHFIKNNKVLSADRNSPANTGRK